MWRDRRVKTTGPTQGTTGDYTRGPEGRLGNLEKRGREQWCSGRVQSGTSLIKPVWT